MYYHKRYDVSNYSGAMQFATEVFHYLNGKVNYMIPANCLIFGHSNMDTAYGDTTLDVVEINIPNISAGVKKDFNDEFNEFNESKFRGMIFYTLIHELLHVDQNTGWYDTRFQNEGVNKVTEIIEKSCHAMTLKVFKDIVNCSLFDDFELDTILIPSSEVFMDIPMNDTEQIDVWRNSYYRVTHPAEKALYFLGTFLTIDFLGTAIKEDATNIVLEIRINGKTTGCDYIYYLNQWMVPQIYNLLRPIAFIAKAKTNITPSQVLVDAESFKANDGSSSGYLSVVADFRTPFHMPIVNQTPNPSLLY